uniref:Uncharacterized protein n=1 Tax=Cucumis sativus TaxID=3659 RepID=A0A0A0K427_CUCSA
MASRSFLVLLLVLALVASSATAGHHHSHPKSPAPAPSPAVVEAPSVPPSSISGTPVEAPAPAANGAGLVSGSMAVSVGIFFAAALFV